MQLPFVPPDHRQIGAYEKFRLVQGLGILFCSGRLLPLKLIIRAHSRADTGRAVNGIKSAGTVFQLQT